MQHVRLPPASIPFTLVLLLLSARPGFAAGQSGAHGAALSCRCERSLPDITLAAWSNVLTINHAWIAPWRGTIGGARSGNIINIGSTLSPDGHEAAASHAASEGRV